MSKVKILCLKCSLETIVSIKELEEYQFFTCRKCLKSFPVDMTEYERRKSERYSKSHVALSYLIRNIDFKVKTNYKSER